ncbi:Scr1 family TA system antitoxin-like transcriptional regulator [Nocardiopsis sp. HUAS JQ3]|uniref:Scr1 family TA system antitoxin-like transcriptional regulator n=1 Tax=Nocardiopsis sp. HUAS JQ3 TaxID=3061629 RepID=UPI0023A9D621|nr:Scr1 family TA system antitoxin-like transcriptional regulator [Nocardiopsis sp. HUAS JQ3]
MACPKPVDPTVVYLETDIGEIYLEEPNEIARYRTAISHLRLAALRPGETIARLSQMSE